MTQATRHRAHEVRETGRTVRGIVEVAPVEPTADEVRPRGWAVPDALTGLRPRPVVFRPWQVGRGRGRRV